MPQLEVEFLIEFESVCLRVVSQLSLSMSFSVENESLCLRGGVRGRVSHLSMSLYASVRGSRPFVI